MKQINSLLAIVILACLISCKDSPEQINTSSKSQENIEIKQLEKPQQKTNAVQLNDGEKWNANLETTEGIKKMQQLMLTFSGKESPTPKVYASLKENLEREFTILFQKCTMKGEAHNQLHNYLKPMLGFFDGLTSSNLNTSKDSYQNLNTHLSQYNNYFE